MFGNGGQGAQMNTPNMNMCMPQQPHNNNPLQ
jgi:hypothetical protein